MRNFDYIKIPEKLLTPEIVQIIASIHEHKGKQELFLEANTDKLRSISQKLGQVLPQPMYVFEKYPYHFWFM